MGETAVDFTKFEGMLQEIQDNLKYTTAEGAVIKITDAFKMFPEIQAKYADLAKRVEDMESKTRDRSWAGLDLGPDGKQFSFLRAINAIKTGQWEKAGLEKEVFDTTRAMSYGDDSAGGYLVPAQAIPDIIEMLRAEAIVMNMGATLLDGLKGGPVTIPKQTGGCTVYWIGENAAVTPSDLAFGQIRLTPRKAMSLIKISNDLVRMASPGAEQMIRNDLALGMGGAIDLKALRGTGTSGEPLGIANTPGINTVTLGSGSGAVPDWNLFYDMEYELALDNALRGKLGVAFHPAIKRALKKLRIANFSGDTGGDWSVMAPTDAEIQAMIGYPFKQTTQLPINLVASGSTNCTEVYMANWAELIIGQWAGFEIMSSMEAGDAFAADQLWIRIITMLDVGVRHPESFCLCNTARIASAN